MQRSIPVMAANCARIPIAAIFRIFCGSAVALGPNTPRLAPNRSAGCTRSSNPCQAKYQALTCRVWQISCILGR
jgi:hypothetical protein